MTSSTRFIEMLPQGVLLEDRDLLLPWGATREELKALDAHCEERETADRWELVWPVCTVLNGLKIRLSAIFYTHSPKKLLDRLDCDHLNDGTYEGARRKYEELKNHITQCCGQPARDGTERAPGKCLERRSIYISGIILIAFARSRLQGTGYLLVNSELWIEKLNELRELAQAKPKTPYQLFGADTHRFRLKKPLDQHQLEKFEKRHRIILPEDYRLFLTTVSGGGPGPNHGILRLSESEQLLPANTRDFLSRGFPHRAPWNNDMVDFEPEKFLCHNLVDSYFDDYHKQGCLPISSVGCGEYTLLVVAGPEYGNIWEDQRVNGGGIWPAIAADGTHLSFKDWFTRWVEETSAFIKSKLDDGPA